MFGPSRAVMHTQLTDSEVAALRHDHRVKGIHENAPVRPQASPALVVQHDAPWNLDRLDQPTLRLDGLYHYASDGSNVNVYVMDTVRTEPTVSQQGISRPAYREKTC